MTHTRRCPTGEESKPGRWRVALAALVALPICAAAIAGTAGAASLNVSPSSITTNYTGQITLTITAVTAGQAVAIDRFADLNGNGIADSGEPIVQSFKVTDGHLPIIGNIRNLNVAGDEDGLQDGQITAKLFYPGVDTVVDRIAGTYIYRVSDPNGVFQAESVPFTITQDTELPQRVTGTVSASGQPLANIPVVLANAQGPGGVGAFTDNNGHYVIYCQPGSYIVVPVAKKHVVDENTTAVIVQAGQSATQDVAVTAGTFTVSGTVSDSAGGGGIPGVVVLANGKNGQSDRLFAAAFTDGNGQYSLDLVPAKWRVTPNPADLARTAHVGPTDQVARVPLSTDTTIDFPLQKATALIYGTVSDNYDQLVSVGLLGYDQSNQYEIEGRSFPTPGNYTYSVGVLAGSWNLGPDTEELAQLGYAGQGATVSGVGDGLAVRQDFVVEHLTTTCIGDCNGDGHVTIDDILTMVDIALGNADVSTCEAGDANHDGQITVDEILTAVNNALNGC